MIINAFKKKLFPLAFGNYYEEFQEESSEIEDREESLESEDREESKEDFRQRIDKLGKCYGPDLINKYFKSKSLKEIIDQLKNYRKDPKTQNKYHMFMINLVFGLNKLDIDIKNMSKNEVKNKRLDYLKDFVRSIVDANQNLDDMPPLQSEEEAAQRQQGQGLKILTPKQMIARLPILSAQLKAVSNSQKLKNEIRQLLYHLYR